MQVKEVEIPYGKSDRFRIYPMGDEHTGTLYCNEDDLKEQIDIIRKDKNALWVGMGDKAEFITPSDPRWEVDSLPKWLHQDNIGTDQEERYCELYRPISHKCLGLLEGNHEDAIRIHSHQDVQKNICKKLGVENLGYSCFIRLKFKRNKSNEVHMVTGFFTHGAGCAITKGAKLNRLQRIMDSFEADFYAHGHMHDIITDEKAYLTLDSRNHIKQKVKVGAVTGCWFMTYAQGVRASYGEKKTYPPSVMGCPVFLIDPNTGTVKVER